MTSGEELKCAPRSLAFAPILNQKKSVDLSSWQLVSAVALPDAATEFMLGERRLAELRYKKNSNHINLVVSRTLNCCQMRQVLDVPSLAAMSEKHVCMVMGEKSSLNLPRDP